MTERDILARAVREQWQVQDWLSFAMSLQREIDTLQQTVDGLQSGLAECRRNKSRLLDRLKARQA